MILKIRDFQFPTYFILKEIELLRDHRIRALKRPVEVYQSGEPDSVVVSGESIKIYHPTSIVKTIYNLISNSAFSEHPDGETKDIYNMALIYMCHEYVYKGEDRQKHTGPPVLISADKCHVPSVIIREVIEPLIGHIDLRPMFCMNCNFTDAARIIENSDSMAKTYGFSQNVVGFHDYPFILMNCKINLASRHAHAMMKQLELNLGRKKTNNVIRKILLDESSGLMTNLITALKVLSGDPDFIVDFLEYMQSDVLLTDEEMSKSSELQFNCIQGDSFLNKHIKLATDNYTPSVRKQWSDFSMLVGLIEKQLGGVRGSEWPASESIGPMEKERKRLMTEKAEEMGKKELNFEQMLENERDYFDHNASRGKIYEELLSPNRVWQESHESK